MSQNAPGDGDAGAPPPGSRAAREQHQEQRVRQRGGQVFRSNPLQLNIPMRPPPIPTSSRGERERLPIPSPFNNPPMRATAMTNLFNRTSMSRSPAPLMSQLSASPSPMFGSASGSPSIGPARGTSYVSSPASLTHRSISQTGEIVPSPGYQTQATVLDPSQRRDSGGSASSGSGVTSGSQSDRARASSGTRDRSSLGNTKSPSNRSDRSNVSGRSGTRDSTASRRDRLPEIDNYNQKIDENDRDIIFDRTPIFSDAEANEFKERDISVDSGLIDEKQQQTASRRRDKGKDRAAIGKENRSEVSASVEDADTSREPLEDFDSIIAPTPPVPSAKKRKSDSRLSGEKAEKKARKSEARDKGKARAVEPAEVDAEPERQPAAKEKKKKSKPEAREKGKARAIEDAEEEPQPAAKKVRKSEAQKKGKARATEDAEEEPQPAARKKTDKKAKAKAKARADSIKSEATGSRKSTDATEFRVPDLPINRKKKSGVRQAQRDSSTQADVDREQAAAAKEAKRLAKMRKEQRRIDNEEIHLFHTLPVSEQIFSNPNAMDIDQKHKSVASKAITKSQRHVNEIDVFWNMLINEVDNVIEQTESRTLLHDIRHFNALLEKEFMERTMSFEHCIGLTARLTTAKAQQKELRKQILSTQKSIADVSKQMSSVQLEWTQSKQHREEMGRLNLWANDVQSRRQPLVADEDMTINKDARVKLRDEYEDIMSGLELIRPVSSLESSLEDNLYRYIATYEAATDLRMISHKDRNGKTVPADIKYTNKNAYSVELKNTAVVEGEDGSAAEESLSEDEYDVFSEDESVGSVSADDLSITSDKVSVGDVSDEEDEGGVGSASERRAEQDQPAGQGSSRQNTR